MEKEEKKNRVEGRGRKDGEVLPKFIFAQLLLIGIFLAAF